MSELPAAGGLSQERDSAERAYLQLLERDEARDVPLLAAAETQVAAECAGLGAALGATLGVVAATLSATVSVTLFGIGVAGPLAAAMIGAAAGAACGAAAGFVLQRRASRHARARDDARRASAAAPPALLNAHDGAT